MLANKPVIITDAMDPESWPAVRDWVTTEGTPNIQFLKQKFGQCEITAHNCKRVVMGGLRTQNMTMAEFLDWWEETHMESEKQNYAEGEDQNLRHEQQQSKTAPAYYMKDWNFRKEYPDHDAYTTPLYFCDDWLNDHEVNIPFCACM